MTIDFGVRERAAAILNALSDAGNMEAALAKERQAVRLADEALQAALLQVRTEADALMAEYEALRAQTGAVSQDRSQDRATAARRLVLPEGM